MTKTTSAREVAIGGLASVSKGALACLGAILTFSLVRLNNESKFVSSFRRPARNPDELLQLHIPSDLDAETSRHLSLNLGGGNCKWQPPSYEVPGDIDFFKTLIAGFPSGDKRMTFMQMEALTGWPAKDEWDFVFRGDSNHPFIKANYPHHEGIWGWGKNADQVVMVIKNIRKSLVEYHDILWDIGYATTWEEANLNTDKLYGERPPLEDFQEWRDVRVLDEVHWYGWFIDFWMEGGLLRDVYTHKITTPEHFAMLMMPFNFERWELDYDLVVGADTVVMPSYDPHCKIGDANGDVSGGCEPVAVVSAEKLLDYNEGAAETTRIANALMTNSKMASYVIDPEAWDCIWKELIVNRKGARTIVDRPNTNYTEADYGFSAEMLEEMITELDRIITKYSMGAWKTLATANRIVDLVTEHKATLQTELSEVNSGVRKLKDHDFLGPKEREKRRQQKGVSSERARPDFKYFDALRRERVISRLANIGTNLIHLGRSLEDLEI